jgi:hypothetical protein
MILGLDEYQSIGFGTADAGEGRSFGFHVEPCFPIFAAFCEDTLGAKSTMLSVEA